MKRLAVSLAAAAVIGGGLAGAAAPAQASVDELRRCVESHFEHFRHDPLDRAYVFTMGVYMCSVQYGYRATSLPRFEHYRACMRKAIVSYQPYLGWEPVLHYSLLCTQEYVGVDVYPNPTGKLG